MLSVVSIFFGAQTGFAATELSWAPAAVSVTEGELFSLAVIADPHGELAYTVKANVMYPADMVSLQSWKYADAWMPVRKPGYDYFSNVEGHLIRTAGYPEGFSERTRMGTATFRAKKSGTATITFDQTSLVLDAENKNVYAGGEHVPIVIGEQETLAVVEPITVDIENPEPGPVPAQLFDIRLLLDTPNVARVADLVARISFTSFGREPTPVRILFTLVDEQGTALWQDEDSVTVETEHVFTKRLSESAQLPELPAGRYVLRAHTVYNEVVGDDFIAPFTISVPETSASQIWLMWVLLIATVILVSLTWLWFVLRKRMREREEDPATPYV